VTVEEPRTRVVGCEADCDVITFKPGVDCVTTDGVDVVVIAAIGASDDVKCMLY
jgi:hypothetical protein